MVQGYQELVLKRTNTQELKVTCLKNKQTWKRQKKTVKISQTNYLPHTKKCERKESKFIQDTGNLKMSNLLN